MNNGSYGTIRMSDVNPSDIDVYYTYMGNRGNDSPIANKLNANDVIKEVKTNTGEVLKGLYNLKLPKDVFNTTGIYNIVITPKGISTKIIDNGILASRPNIRGIVLDLNDTNIKNQMGKVINGGLDGFRIEYKGKNNIYRIITSSNRCEAINDVSMSTSQKQVRYRYNELSNLMFLTLTPSGSNDTKVNSSAFLGEVGDDITVYNTYFDPIMIELELVDITIETISNALLGNQIETKDGRLTIYTNDSEKLPFKEYNLFTVKNDFDVELARVKMGVDIDDDNNFEDTINNIRN